MKNTIFLILFSLSGFGSFTQSYSDCNFLAIAKDEPRALLDTLELDSWSEDEKNIVVKYQVQ